MHYHIWTVGCQMNVADSERIDNTFRTMGGVPAPTAEAADVVVLNTCSVRKAAEDRAFGKLAALKGLKLKKPDLIVVLAGCMVGDDSILDLQRKLPFVDAFVRPADLDALRETVRTLSPAGSFLTSTARWQGTEGISANLLKNHDLDVSEKASGNLFSPVRWVPVISGCNRSCSYCIVPARRGVEHSREIDEIEAEVRDAVSRGTREVRLLGQIVDRYGWDLPDQVDLADLFYRLQQIPELQRIRFLTSHPRDMKQRVIEAVADTPKVCEDISIPVQAGNDAVLKSMRRGYTVDHFRKLIDQMRGTIPGVALSTDVIVGYPGETEAQFQDTLDLLAEIQFDIVHVAMYSPRRGTIAFGLADDVSPAIKKERLQRVERLQETIATNLNANLVNTTVEVLVEGKSKGKWEGRTRGNKSVFFVDDRDWCGRIAWVKIQQITAWSLQGTVTTTA